MKKLCIFLMFILPLTITARDDNYFGNRKMTFYQNDIFPNDYKLIEKLLPDDKSRFPLYGYTLTYDQTPKQTFYTTELQVLHFGDIDGDGDKEVVMLARNYNDASAFFVLFSGYELKFLPAKFINERRFTDIDKDGKKEFIVSSVSFGLNGKISLGDIVAIDLPLTYCYGNFWLRSDLVQKLNTIASECVTFKKRGRLCISDKDGFVFDYGGDIAECVLYPFVVALYAGDKVQASYALQRAVFETSQTRFKFVRSIVGDLLQSPYAADILCRLGVRFDASHPNADAITRELLRTIDEAFVKH